MKPKKQEEDCPVQKKRRRLFLAAAILWMAVIFLFSSRDGELSTQDSYRTGEIIGEMFVEGYKEWTPDRKLVFLRQIDHAVRKTAHFSEYALLAMFWFGAFLPALSQMFRLRPYGLSWFAAALYAVTDELHQLFVAERAGSPMDVGIDSLGAAAGLLAAFLLCLLLNKTIFRKPRTGSI